jgi:hypothetical protein
MMDNPAHHHHQQVVQQLTHPSPQNSNPLIQQQQSMNRTSSEPEHFLTVRLLMQGKVSGSHVSKSIR